MPSERFRRRRLPHWDRPGAAYFVTTCLEGSIPAEGLLDLIRNRERLALLARPSDIPAAQWTERLAKLDFARTDHWLDRQSAVRHLEDPELAGIVVDAVRFFDGHRYDLLAYAVMPSHFHWVFLPLPGWIAGLEKTDRSPREQIIHSINRHTAYECNKRLGKNGEFWQHESYDHWVRDGDELERIIEYVEANPVKAGLVSAADLWPFSSARCERKD